MVVERACAGEDGHQNGYRSPELLHLTTSFLVRKSFTERPRGSNSIEKDYQWLTYERKLDFFMRLGVTKILFRKKEWLGVERVVWPMCAIGRD